MAGLKSLAKDTAIYGVSSIVGRFLNYLLVPIYTISMPASTGGYGVITNMYAITALLLVLLTCGMETGFFRFAYKGLFYYFAYRRIDFSFILGSLSVVFEADSRCDGV